MTTIEKILKLISVKSMTVAELKNETGLSGEQIGNALRDLEKSSRAFKRVQYVKSIKRNVNVWGVPGDLMHRILTNRPYLGLPS